ncbi:integrase, catalytic region, zinc finger, CCHC-type containing protein [Tanacetum coccineum]
MGSDSDEQKHFVLVHGLYHGAWCWFKLIPLLEAMAHRVSAFDLLASGTNTKVIQQDRTLSDYTTPLLKFMATLLPEEKDLELAEILVRTGSLFLNDLDKEQPFSEKGYGSVTQELKGLFLVEKGYGYGQLKEQVQGRGNMIRELKEKISRLSKKNSEAHLIPDFKALDSHNKDLTVKVNALQDLNERIRVENVKVKQYYKELYNSINITRAKTIENTTSLLTEIENLKAQLKGKIKCVTMPAEKPKVLAPGMYAINVEPILPHQSNNREVYLDYIRHLKESVEALCEIVEKAIAENPLDNALHSA